MEMGPFNLLERRRGHEIAIGIVVKRNQSGQWLSYGAA
jgi:hypothetical protein